MRKLIAFVSLAAATVTAACEGLGQAMTAHTDVVARAAGHELTVDHVAAIMRLNPRLPAQPEVVEAIANFWVDYVLLATAAAEDSSLRSVDLTPVVQPEIDQALLFKLRDKVIQVDTAFTDEELRALYEKEQPGLQIRARHILLRLPPDATPAQRDSAMALAKDLQQRAAAGADFAALATEYSQDPGSAREGGDLGMFGRGQMVPQFEEAAFALDVGEVSDVVETPFGLHIIKVEERQLPDFEQVKESFRVQAQGNATLEAEEAYVRNLTEPLSIKVEEDAYEVARELARKPDTKLGSRAASRALVSYKGGEFSAAEYRQEVIRRFDPTRRAALAQLGDEQMAEFLTTLTRFEILLAEARRAGVELEPAERDSIMDNAVRRLAALASAAGLRNIQPRQGETTAQAIDRAVRELLEGIAKGERSALPLGPLSYSLREQYGGAVFERAFPAVVAAVQATRPAQAPPSLPPPQPQAQPQPDAGASR
jgi:peptidyl-prolyl cis-trans isomerase D